MDFSKNSSIPPRYKGYLFAIMGVVTICIFSVTWYKSAKNGQHEKEKTYSGIVGAKSRYGLTSGGDQLLIDGTWRTYPIDLARKLDKYVKVGDSAYKFPNEWKVIIYRKDSIGVYRPLIFYDPY
jgi:hypothetical protein